MTASGGAAGWQAALAMRHSSGMTGAGGGGIPAGRRQGSGILAGLRWQGSDILAGLRWRWEVSGSYLASKTLQEVKFPLNLIEVGSSLRDHVNLFRIYGICWRRFLAQTSPKP